MLRLAGVVLFLLLVVCGDAVAADPFWHSVYPSTSGKDLFDVSCAAPTVCLAVGGTGEAVVQDGDYQYEATADPVTLNAISCAPGTRFCMAVDDQGSVVSYSDGEFGDVQNIAGNVAFESVSCPTATFCMAIDHDYVTWRYADGTWTQGTDFKLGTYNNFTDVGCASPSYCVALLGNTDALRYATWNGSNWSVQKPVVDRKGTGGTGDDVTELGYSASLTCTSESFCLTTTSKGNADRFDGSLWTVTTVVANHRMRSGCAATTCRAIDELTTKVYDSPDGVTWPSVGTSITDTGLSGASAVDCVAVDLCVAVSGTEASTYARGITPTTNAVLSGTGQVGQTLTVAHAAIDEARAFFVNQWFRCDNQGSTCVQIEGVKGPSYSLTAEDAGKYVEARDFTGIGLDEEGPNLVRNREFVSNSILVGDVAAPSPSPSPSPSVSPSPSPSPAPVTPSLAGKVRTGKKSVSIPLTCAAACSGSVKLWSKGKRKVGSARFSIAAGRTKRIKVKLSKAARKVLRRKGKLKVTLTFAPSGLKQTLTLKRKR